MIPASLVRFLLAAVAIALVVLPARTASAAIELTCANIVRQTLESRPNVAMEADRSLIGANIVQTFKNIMKREETTEELSKIADIDGYYMTATSGNALFVDCSSGLRKLVYFPVGRVMEARVPFEQDGEVYVLAETENGLHLIFDRDWLVPVGPEDIYFVWEGYGQMPLCIGGAYSRGSCDPLVRTRATEPKMSGDASYTHATYAELAGFGVPKDKITWMQSQVEKVATYTQNALIEPEAKAAHIEARFGAVSGDWKLWRDEFCGVINAGALYSRGNRPGLDSPDWEVVSLSLCQRPAEAALLIGSDSGTQIEIEPRPVKIITRDSIAMRSIPSVSMVFPNASDVGFRALIELSALPDRLTILPSLHTKNCREKLSESIDRDINALVEAGPRFKAFEARLRGQVENNQTIDVAYGVGEMFRTSALLIIDDNAASPFDRFLDIRMISVCEFDTPKKLRTIIFEHPTVDRNRIEIDTDDLLEVYNIVASEVSAQGYPVIVENYGKITDRERLHDIGDGIFWEIKDHNEYLLWRDTLQTMLANDGRVSSGYYGKGQEGEQRHLMMLNHYAYVLMTAVFRSDYRPPWDIVPPEPELPDWLKPQ